MGYIVAELDTERHSNPAVDSTSDDKLKDGSDASQADSDASQEQAPARSEQP